MEYVIGNADLTPFELFEVQNENEMNSLDKSGIAIGTRCFVLALNETYILNEQKRWEKIPQKGAVYFFPEVTRDERQGITTIRWSNNGGLDNPPSFTIKDGESGIYIGSGKPQRIGQQVKINPSGRHFVVPNVLQSTGDSTTDTISQKAISTFLKNLEDRLTNLEKTKNN